MEGLGRALSLAGLLVLLAPSAACPAGPSCHCFRDRDYDPAHPEKTDLYLLATAANSLLSAACGVPKRQIVQARMSGITGEDLWIAACAAQRQGTAADGLLQARAAAGSWKEVFRSGGRPLEPLGPRFVAALAGGADDVALARLMAAETLAVRLGTPWTELDELAVRGATLQEAVLAGLIGLWSSRPAPAVYSDFKSGKTGWSRLLAAEGRVPQQMEAEISKVLRPAGR